MKIRKKSISVLFSVAFIFSLLLFYGFKANKSADEIYTPVPKWKNLKVLPKDISKDSLDYLMKSYTIALSVNCNHCHAAQKDNPKKLDFASDDKIEKEIARGMIHMTNEINKKYFQPHFPDPKPTQVYVANCVMCHRGAVNPEKYLSQMQSMYKTYNPDRDNRKEEIIKKMPAK